LHHGVNPIKVKKDARAYHEAWIQIDALLPQTQCGQCGYPGCRPYAEAIAQGAPINQCPPGGNRTIAKLAHLLKQEIIPLNPAHGELSETRKIAFIREAECIGCTKCIQACPVDAILGAAKKMHTVIADECTGCDLCIEPCPVDCIDMIPVTADPIEEEETAALARANHWRIRFNFRTQRIQQEQKEKRQKNTSVSIERLAPTQTPERLLQQSKSIYITALKQWKDAERALQHMTKYATNTPEIQAKIAHHQTQVEQLKQAAEFAKEIFEQAKIEFVAFRSAR